MNRSDRNKLSGLFALSLTLSIIFGVYQPLYSQTPSPRDALTEEIREDVVRHIEIRNAPLDHPSIKELYFEKAQAAGLTYEQLIDLYEQEYVEQKQAQKPGPWEQFKPNISWLISIVSMAVLAYVTILKSWIEARIASVNNWLYGQFSGTPLFRNIALRKYRAALVQNYEQLQMPFLKNRDPLKMEDVYVPLKVSMGAKEDRENDTARTPKHEQIEAYRAIANHRRLMVTGEPGSGKSVLLKYLSWSYGLGKLEGLTERPIVVLLELYRLSDGKLNEAKLIEALVKTFDRNQFPNAQQFVLQGLKNGLFLLLLDGLDEVSSDVRGHVVGVIRDLLRKYDRCRVVITCRTAVYEDEFSDIVERKLEVVEFTDLQMQRFLKAWDTEMLQARKSISQMMAALRERPLIMKLARNPLLLTLIAYLYTEPAFVLPRSRAEFYTKSTGILLEQRGYKGDADYKHNRYEANEKRRVLQHLALYAQDNSSNLKDRRSVKADVIREQVKAVLPDLDIPLDQAKDILEEIVERSGLFMKIDGGERYIFPHLTIQEYFSAAALEGQDTKLIKRFEADPTAWREVIKLWCSLANESTAVVRAVYERDAITGFECLAEAGRVDPALASHIIERFKPQLDQPQVDETLTQAFGTVAANERTRGQDVFNFLVTTLDDFSVSSQRRTAAADALSRTNLPKAAAALINWYVDRASIIRMGDLAVPKLAALAEQGKLDVQEDLYFIGTPDAAASLVSLLWHNNETVASRAAWLLGGLLSQTEIEQSLNDYPLTPQQQQSERLDWIWQPFNVLANSSLPDITGRIAYWLQITSWSGQINPPKLDPRLVVPLCAIQMQVTSLPKKLPGAVSSLLEQTDGSSEIDKLFSDVSKKLLENSSSSEQQWMQLLRTLSPSVELDLLSRLINQRQPNRRSWQYLFQTVDYELRTGWHYRTVLILSGILSAIATVQIGFLRAANPDNLFLICSSVVGIPVSVVFWLALKRGDDTAFPPNLFWQMGVWGIPTYIDQCAQLLRKGITWSFVGTLYETIIDDRTLNTALVGIVAFAFAFALTGPGPFVGPFAAAVAFIFFAAGSDSFAVAVAVIFAVVIAVAVAVAVPDAVAGPVAVAAAGLIAVAVYVGFFIASLVTAPVAVTVASPEAIAVAAAGLIAGTVAGGPVAVTVAGPEAVAAAVAAAVAGGPVAVNGIGSWYQLKKTPEKKWLRLLVLLSFSWFCWFPLTITFSIWALYDLLTNFPIFNIPPWQQTAIIASAFTTLCTTLWWRGKWLDARAKNPFHGGALGKALSVNQ